MTENNDNNDSNKDDSNNDDGGDAITIEDVASFKADELTEEQTTFLKDNADDLSDEQKETFASAFEGDDDEGDDDEDEDEDEKNTDPDKLEIETREKEKENDGDGDEGDDDDEMDPEEKKNVQKVVDDSLTDFRGTIDKVQGIKDQQDVNEYVSDNPDFKPYSAVMLKYMAHPAYKNLPVKHIASIVAAADLQKMGAKKERKATKKAKDTQDGGSTVRKPGGGKTDWANATKRSFRLKGTKYWEKNSNN